MSSVKNEIFKGVFWTALARYSGFLLSIIITAILARKITPEAFGTMAIATVIMAFLDIILEMGLSSAIIQFKDLSKKQINTIFVFSWVIGLIVAVIMFFLSKYIAVQYNDQSLSSICKLLCIIIIFNSLNIVPNGLMLKHKRFKAIAVRTLSIQIIAGTISIWGAFKGWGVYALILTPIVTSIGVFIINFVNYPQSIIINCDFSIAKKVIKYSGYQFLFSIINYWSRNIDKLIIGKYYSMTDLGYYDKSYRLMLMPIQLISSVISPVLHPVLSNFQNDVKEIAIKATKILVFISRISFPIGLILFFCAKEIITIVFGPDWSQAVPVFMIFALSLPVQLIASPGGIFYQSIGRTDLSFLGGLLNTIVTISGFIIAAIFFKHITAIAWAWTISQYVTFSYSYVIVYKYGFKTSCKELYKKVSVQIINIIISAGICITLFNIYIPNNDFVAVFYKSIIILFNVICIGIILKQYSVTQIITILKEIKAWKKTIKQY